MQDIDNIISDCINQINIKITGINFLEKLKYPLIDKLKLFNSSNLEKYINKEFLDNYGDNKFSSKIEKISDNRSKIRNKNEKDLLSIVFEGFKTITIKENLNSNNSDKLYLTNFTGIVLEKNTIFDEIIKKNTILLNISIDAIKENP